MGLFGRLKRKPRKAYLKGPFFRNYEAAQTTRHNTNHWTNASNKDADAEISVALPTLRQRARYEIRNNSYAKGILSTLGDDIIGTGPTINVLTDSEEFNERAEAAFKLWAQAPDQAGRMNLAEMLRLTIGQFVESGEALFIKGADPEASGVQYRLLMIEPDRLKSPWGLEGRPDIRDGVGVDDLGRPINYYILKNHPGSAKNYHEPMGAYDIVPAEKIYHLYRQDRPGQSRGVPWLTPALELFAQLRRYTQAVIAAAETAADFSAVMKSTAADLSPVDVDELDTIDIERRTLLTLPAGWEMQQFKAENPPAGYSEFKKEILNEIGRCFCMPYNVTAADSRDYNYASGRLDWQVYYRMIRMMHAWLAGKLLVPIFYDWLAEARNIRGLLPLIMLNDPPPVEIYWPGAEHVDPQKEATGEKIRLENLTLSLAEVYARQGKDWKTQLQQIAREKELIKELDIKPAAPAGLAKNEDEDEDEDGDEKEDEKEKKESA